MTPLRIVVLFDAPELCGGVLNATSVARLLARDGCHVTLCADGPKPAWIDWPGPWHDHHRFQMAPPKADLAIATYFTTVDWALRLGLPRIVHFCQGYEGDLGHLHSQLPAIESVYRQPLPTWVVSPALSQRLACFGRQTSVIPPHVSSDFRPALRWRPANPPRILVTGIFEAEVKNVKTALQAVQLMRENGLDCRVERLSTWPQSDAERALLTADTFHMNLAPAQVPRFMRRFDLLLFTSHAMEGFGLPALEGLRSGVPVVISHIPSLASYTAAGVASAAPGDAEAFSTEALRILRSPAAWRHARRTGLAAARHYDERSTLASLREALGRLPQQEAA